MRTTNDLVNPPEYTEREAVPPDYDAAKAASEAIRAVHAIEGTFASLKRYFAGQGIASAEKLLVSVDGMKNRFCNIVNESRTLAVQVAQYAENFDQIIIQFCSDSSVTRERRIERIREFIGESNDFKTRAQGIVSKLVELDNDFAVFGDRLLAWATTVPSRYAQKRNRDGARAKRTNAERQKIEEQRYLFKSALAGVGSSTLTPTGFFTFINQLVEPMVKALAAFGTLVWLTLEPCFDAALEFLTSCRLGKEDDKPAEIEKSIRPFAKNISAVCQVWRNVVDDAIHIQGWLESGEKYAAEPKYMKKSLKKGVKTYEDMALYLRAYTRGLPVAR